MLLCNSRLKPLVLALGLLSLPSVGIAQPAPSERAEARRHFQSGVNAFSHRDWRSALDEFQSAYRIAPNPVVRVNIANCLSELGRTVESLHHFEQFLVESPNAPAAQRAEIQQHIQSLLARVSEVTLSFSPSNPPELSPTIDEASVTPGQALRVAPGHHVITVTALGFTASRREIDTSPGSHDAIQITLEPEPPPPITPPTTPPQLTPEPRAPTPPVAPTIAITPPPFVPTEVRAPARTGPPPALLYATLGATAAAGVAWAVCGGVALSANRDFDATVNAIQQRQGDPNTLDALGHDQARRAERFALMSDIAMGVTLAGAAASVTLFALTRFTRSVHVVAAVTPSGGAVTLGGNF